MAIRWKASLSVGVPVVDAQHRELIRRAAALMEAMRAARGAAQVGRMLRYLVGYAATHFTAEEQLMLDRVYPGIEAHAREHDELRARARALVLRCQESGPVPMVAVELNVFVCEWFYDHIGTSDRALAAWLHGHRAGRWAAGKSTTAAGARTLRA